MKLILSYDQARHLLQNLPAGKSITLSVQDANKILYSKPSTQEVKKNQKR